jgi:hypothetical protein
MDHRGAQRRYGGAEGIRMCTVLARHRHRQSDQYSARQLVVLTGSVAALDELLLEPIRPTVRQRVRMFPVDSVAIERSVLGDRARLLGGIALGMRQFATVKGTIPADADSQGG